MSDATSQATSDATERTADLLDAIGREELLAQIDESRPRIWRGLATSPALFGWDDLNNLLSRHPLEPSRLTLAKDRGTIPHETYTTQRASSQNLRNVVPEALHEQLAGGATLVLNSVDELHEDTERTAADLERMLHSTVLTNLYGSWTETQGFGLHFDDQEVIVVQLSGRKRWRYYPPTRTAALLHDVVRPPRPTSEPYADVVLEEGDVLYLPRGWWHGASASEGTPSLHLTYSVIPTTGVDFFRWFIRSLPAEECFRVDLPLRGTAADKDAHVRRMKDVLSEMLARPGLTDRFLDSLASRDNRRIYTNLPAAVTAPPASAPAVPAAEPVGLPAAVRLSYARGRIVEGGTDERPVFTAAGYRWEVGKARRVALETLWDGAWHTVEEVREAVSEESWPRVELFLADLLHRGLVTGTSRQAPAAH
ncbi:cupin-like domain-containing protein [Streptomyces sp. ISL-43]|uniref:cupin domain-containing protein n=1 Tax=Streptomyces sp. ISL-43 TaxID=2819183 RepID=UPI001BE6F041|nr:cupin domain-containing protein [Streptomyces sp. ISL-43]MBT2452269.1 cupin-like domain-containing protein [Streptomyces sp. ISL-43]